MPTGMLVGTRLVFHTRPSPAACPASREASGQGHQVCNWVPVAFVAAGEMQPTSAREMETAQPGGIK